MKASSHHAKPPPLRRPRPASSESVSDLDDSVEKLKQEILQCKVVEESLRSSQQTSSALLEKSRRLQKELQQLSHQLLSTQEEERRRISRDLHDVIAQILTGIHVRLAALKSGPMSGLKELQKEIAHTQRLVEKSVEIVHRFARDLRPTVLDDLGLIPALRSFMKHFTEETGVRVSLKTYARIEELDAAKRTVLYRVAQEALNNVARHARASHAEVNIVERDGMVRMEIVDDGKGFEVQGKTRSSVGGRVGILGMRERVEMIGGRFRVESAPGKPTTVRVEIPPEKTVGAKTAAVRRFA